MWNYDFNNNFNRNRTTGVVITRNGKPVEPEIKKEEIKEVVTEEKVVNNVEKSFEKTEALNNRERKTDSNRQSRSQYMGRNSSNTTSNNFNKNNNANYNRENREGRDFKDNRQNGRDRSSFRNNNQGSRDNTTYQVNKFIKQIKSVFPRKIAKCRIYIFGISTFLPFNRNAIRYKSQ